MPTSKRVARMRAAGLAVLMVGLLVTFLVGTMFPAQVTTVTGTTVKVTDYTKTPASGETAFNWLLALLVMGPAVIASAVIFSAAEVAASTRRSNRSRNHDRLEVGDEL
jgi:hypothetical protein